MRVNRRFPALNGERGASAVIVALLMVVVIGMAALVVDGGGLYFQRRRMVRATDAASLAAAQWCAQNYGAAQGDSLATRADGTAQDPANVDNSVRVGDFLFGPIGDKNPTGTSQCNGGAQSGVVKAKYKVPEGQAFAPILGFGRNHDVSAVALATWGTAGGGIGVAPFMLTEGQLTDCNIPYGVTKGDTCHFWFNNKDIGNAQWAQVNLAAWNVAGNASCPSAGTNQTINWINGQAPALALNYPEPTYVCRDTGFAESVVTKGMPTCPTTQYNGLQCQVGKELPYPVNDAYGVTPPGPSGTKHGQVDQNGNLAPPPASPHKYDIVGFATLLLQSVHKGNKAEGGATECNMPADANAWCLTLVWEDYQTTGLNPGNGQNFGTLGVGLSG